MANVPLSTFTTTFVLACLAGVAFGKSDEVNADFPAVQNGRLVREYEFRARPRPQVVYPAGAPQILSDYGSAINMSGVARTWAHNGIDLGRFGEPVIAMASGVVVYARNNEWGNRVDIEHGRDDDGIMFRTSYGHLHEIHVKHGQTVRRGEVIGLVGSTGKAAGNIPHVHVMVLKVTDEGAMGSMNPHRFWYDGPGKISCFKDTEVYREASNFTRDGSEGVSIRFTYPLRCRSNQ